MNESSEFSETFESLTSPFVPTGSETEFETEDERRKRRRCKPVAIDAPPADQAPDMTGGTEGTEGSQDPNAEAWETAAEAEAEDESSVRARAKGQIDDYRRGRMGTPTARPTAKPAAAPTFLKNAADLKTVPLPPQRAIGIDRELPGARKAVAATYNRVGGLMGALATRLNVELAAVLAVWRVESGGRTHTPGKAIIRFENHLLFRLWGASNLARYNTHFRHGGHAGQAGKSWEGHQLRAGAAEPFTPIHTGSQANEYRALELATRLAGENVALQCISIGGPQILIANHRRLGYATPRQMYDAFQASERWQVIGFFDFCRNTKNGQLVAYLRARDWERFAYYYNGKGQVATYGGHLTDAYQAAQAIAVAPAREAEWEEMEGQEEAELEWEKDPMSETWETAPEAEWEWEVANE